MVQLSRELFPIPPVREADAMAHLPIPIFEALMSDTDGQFGATS